MDVRVISHKELDFYSFGACVASRGTLSLGLVFFARMQSIGAITVRIDEHLAPSAQPLTRISENWCLPPTCIFFSVSGLLICSSCRNFNPARNRSHRPRLCKRVLPEGTYEVYKRNMFLPSSKADLTAYNHFCPLNFESP